MELVSVSLIPGLRQGSGRIEPVTARLKQLPASRKLTCHRTKSVDQRLKVRVARIKPI